MKIQELKDKVADIVDKSLSLVIKYTEYKYLPVNYACIFGHTESEYTELNVTASQLGEKIKETYSGPIYKIKHISTKAGELKLLKIRKPDPKKKGNAGYANFTLPDFDKFKEDNLNKPNYKLFHREDYEIIGLYVENSDVWIFFANPPLDEQLGV